MQTSPKDTVRNIAIAGLIGQFSSEAYAWLLKRATGWGYIVAGGITGIALWFVAQGILAPFIGRSFMMDFGTYTQSSFVSHAGMTLVMGAVFQALEKRRTNPGQLARTG